MAGLSYHSHHQEAWASPNEVSLDTQHLIHRCRTSLDLEFAETSIPEPQIKHIVYTSQTLLQVNVGGPT